MQPQDNDRSTGWLHRVPPAWRLASAFVLVLFVAMLPRKPHPIFVAPGAVITALWLFSGMPLLRTLRRLLIAEFFIVGIAGLSLLAPGSAPLVLSAILKSNLCVLTMLILGWTTPLHQLIGTLRSWGMPPIMLTTITLMYRYLPVVRDESHRMQRAIASRTYVPGKWSQWRAMASVAGQLFIRSVDRAERIYLAMCARGWK